MYGHGDGMGIRTFTPMISGSRPASTNVGLAICIPFFPVFNAKRQIFLILSSFFFP
jgi:hypothetical protein